MAVVIAPPDMLPEMMIAPRPTLLFVVAIIPPSSFSKAAANCWKKGVQDPPHCLTSVKLTPAWILPPSYMDQLPGSINQLKVYCYDEFILEVSFGGKLEKYIFVRC
jgi:hypothetical protein